MTLELELGELLAQLRRELAELRRDRADVLDVSAVCDRYGLHDARTARAIMRETGGAFTVARRVLVHRATLEAWERAQRSGDEELDAPDAPAARPRRRRPTVLPPDFFEQGSS
jgi:hypothetical protein